ncbi:LuxR family transcriptional regulator [Pilimelia anulata]|uniref:LuxR family transcriptional regulator n=1 Tax=Pilimelia anulata TaxID=53371 RepID=A0A8J3B707_9ACTN|nr:helix-turn-helix transcriptional regulator [Pilimelia anulata]GGK00200.1 LuxR family transcriptional regulator [Pilimelia anulata]
MGGVRAPALVGRAAELRALRTAAAAPPAVILLAGEAGVGKTRLVLELLDHPDLAGAAVLAGACHPAREPYPYGAIVDALRGAGAALDPAGLTPAAAVLRDLVPELSPHLPDGPGGRDRHRVLRAAREVLAACGRALLVVEDLHWADEGTRELLRFVAADPPPGLTLLLTHRPGGLPLGGAYRPRPGVRSLPLALAPLTPDGVRELAAGLLGGAGVSAGFADRLHERTAGIPFVVEEALRSLPDPAAAARADGAAARRLLAGAAVPVLLREAMAERLGAAPAAAGRLAGAAAVLGVPAPAERLAVLVDLPPAEAPAAVAGALAHDLLVDRPDGLLDFRHALAREAARAALTGPERRHLHGRAADLLAADEPRPLVPLAEHSRLAGRRADWLRYGVAAADRAAARTDATTAADLLHRLLAEPGLPPADLDRLAVRVGRVAQYNTDQRDSLAVLAALLRDPRLSAGARAHLRLFHGLLLFRQPGAARAARAELERAADELADRPDLAARAVVVLASPVDAITPLAELAAWTARADAHLAAAADEEQRHSLRASTLSSRILVGDPAAYAEAVALRPAVTAMPARREVSRMYYNVADACANIGRFARARTLLRTGADWARGADIPFDHLNAVSIEMRLDWFAGRWAGLARRAADLADEHRDVRQLASELRLVAGWLATVTGAADEAVAHFTAVGAADPAEAIAPVALSAIAGLIRVRLAAGDATPAAADADRGAALLRHKGVWAWAGELLPAALAAQLAADRPETAARLLADAERGARTVAAPLVTAALAAGRGQLAAHRGDAAGAAAHFRTARTAYRDLGCPYYAALTAEWAATAAAPADTAAASYALAELVDTHTALGAPVDAARCGAALRTLRAAEPGGRGRPGHGWALSPREVAVARLLTAGRSNRGIAAELYVSPRTAELHVGRVLHKLGVDSRHDVPVILHDL